MKDIENLKRGHEELLRSQNKRKEGVKLEVSNIMTSQVTHGGEKKKKKDEVHFRQIPEQQQECKKDVENEVIKVTQAKEKLVSNITKRKKSERLAVGLKKVLSL